MNYSNLPEKLRKDGHFCTWRYETRGDKRTKVPFDPKSGKNAKSNDISTFSDLGTALSVIDRYDGLGFGVFGEFSGIDIDHCVDEYGTISALAFDIIKIMDSYTELSPSGTGVHIYFRTKDFSYDKERYYIKCPKDIEVYIAGCTNKYLTCTGRVLSSFNQDFGYRDEQLKTVLEKYMKRELPVPAAPVRLKPSPAPAGISDDGIIARIGNDPLWNGDWEGSYASHSEADLALCCKLAFWTGKDESRMDSLFRVSGLMRPKWDEMHGRTTYGEEAIRKACSFCSETYSGDPLIRPPVILPRGKYADSGEIVFGEIVPLKKTEVELSEFPVHALPEAAFHYCRAVADSTQTDPSMAAMFCLTSMALANQNKYLVRVKPGWTEPLNLYTVICAPPSERKSPVQRCFTEVIDEYEFAFNEKIKPKIVESRNAVKNLERRINIMKRELSSAWDPELSEEINALEQEKEEMKQIRERQFYGDNITPESLQRDLYENDGVFSIISTEGGLFDNVGGKYSGKADYDILLKSFYGERARLSRIGRGKQDLPKPYLTIMISCQPAVLGEVMQDRGMRGKGLLARFNYVFPCSRVGFRTFESEPVPKQLEENYKGLILKMLYVPEPELPQILTFSPEAEKIMSDYFADNEKYMTHDGKEFSDWCGKHVGVVARIAANLFVALRKSPDETEIGWETAQRAVTIGECLREHARYAFTVIGVNEDMNKAEAVLAKLREINKPIITRHELYRKIHSNTFTSVSTLEAPLEILENYGYLVQAFPERKERIGRNPAKAIYLNPKLLKSTVECEKC